MKIAQQIGLLLSGTMAFSAWSPSWAKENDAQLAKPTIPVHEAPPQSWPEPPKAPAGAPNVVLILVDDVGFGATSTFGGPIATPTFDKLAQSGLRYNSFHVNSLCSPTRAALLTGRNNHEVGFGSISEWSAPYPGYNTLLPKSSATIAEVLKENGYSTAAFGKWHNTPIVGQPVLASSTSTDSFRPPTTSTTRASIAIKRRSSLTNRRSRAITSPPTLPMKQSTGCISTMRSPATSHSSSTTPPARRTRRIRCRRSGLISTKASSIRVGM